MSRMVTLTITAFAADIFPARLPLPVSAVVALILLLMLTSDVSVLITFVIVLFQFITVELFRVV